MGTGALGTGEAPSPAARSNALSGILYLCGGLSCFACQDALIKGLLSHYSVLQILFTRSLVAGAILALFVLWRFGVKGFRSRQPRLQALRAGCVLAAFVCMYSAIAVMPLAEVITLFSAAPLIITALCGPILGERVSSRRWCAVLVGFGGVLLMLNPGSDVFEPSALLALAAAVAYAGSALISRKMGRGDPSSLLGVYTNLAFILGCGAGLLLVSAFLNQGTAPELVPSVLRHFQWPRPNEMVVMLGAGVVTLGGFVLVPKAYQVAPASVVSPFEYTYLLWAMIIGFFFFAEIPSLRVIGASSLIVAAGIYIAQLEARRQS